MQCCLAKSDEGMNGTGNGCVCLSPPTRNMNLPTYYYNFFLHTESSSRDSRVGAVNYPFANLILYINYN